MLNIGKSLEDLTLTVTLEGRLDTTTASQLEEELRDSLPNVTKLVLDMSRADVRDFNDVVMEIFEVTGFTDILTIE